MLADYHVHTEFSDDSFYPMEDVVKDAIAKGIDEICFTDHVDYGVKRDHDDPRGIIYYENIVDEFSEFPLTNVDYPRYFEKISKMRELYGDRISIKTGLEFGIQRHTIEEFKKLYDRYEFDFIINSNHQVGDLEFWTGDYAEGRTHRQFHIEYYEETLAVIKEYKDYCVLGHIDAINRYDNYGSEIDFSVISDIVEAILRQAIYDGKGIELNTSGERYNVGIFTPGDKIFRMYRELGGEILTIGSDSHKPEHLGYNLTKAREYLKSLGFKYFATYDNMKPIMNNL